MPTKQEERARRDRHPKRNEDPERGRERPAPFSRGLPLTPEFEEAWERTAARREIGRKLEQMRRNANLTQAELASRMGKNQAFVARMESGRGDMPKAENVALFAHHCGFATAYAFIDVSEGEPLTLHELQPIRQSEVVTATLETLHDVVLPATGPSGVED
jgi:transcriptional regulator with XRE-family HTH domain